MMSTDTIDATIEQASEAPLAKSAIKLPSPDDGSTRREPRPTKRTTAGDVCSAEFLFLAIFLNLMAYFAVLVAISDFDEVKTRAALGSLHDVFGVDHRRGDEFAFQPQTESGVQLAAARARLEKHLNGLAALTLQADRQDGDQLSFALAPEALFKEPFAQIREDRTVLLARLVDLLLADGAEAALVLELSTPADIGTAAGDVQVHERAEALIAAVNQLSAPMDAVSFRLRSGPNLSWRFRLVPAERSSS